MASIAKKDSVVSKKSRTSQKSSLSKKDSTTSKKDSVSTKKSSTTSKKSSVTSNKSSTGSKKGSIASKKESSLSRKSSASSKRESIVSRKSSTSSKNINVGSKKSRRMTKKSIRPSKKDTAKESTTLSERESIMSRRASKNIKSHKGAVSIREPRKSSVRTIADERDGESLSRGKFKRKTQRGDDSRSVVQDTLGSAVRASTSSAQQSGPRLSRTAEQVHKREVRDAREAREERLEELGSMGVIEKTEEELYLRRQIVAIDAGAAMPFDMTNPAEAALAAILKSITQGGAGSPAEAAMRAILESVTGVTDVRLPSEVREFMQHVLEKATGLLDVDPDSDVGKALTTLVEAVQKGKPEAVAACQLALKDALERALKAQFLTMPTRMGEAAVGQLIAADTLEMALMSVNEALLTGRARIILQEAKEMKRRGEDIWMFMMRMKCEVTQVDQRRENIRRWKRMGGITQVPWTPTKRRGPIAAEYQSPGPACVALPNLIGGAMCIPDSKRARAPAFSFGSRHGGKNDSPGPGPGQYNVTGLSAKGKDSPPAASLHSRPKDYKAIQTPAPGDYNPEKSEKMVHDNAPKYTFGLKTLHEKPSSTPAPNVYNIPTVLGATKEGNKKQAPAFTISGRQKDKPDDRVLNPGPGSYNNSKADNYKMRSPAYSISSRYQLPTDSTQKPGPGAHSPEKVRMDNIPAHTFGIKHSPYMGVLKAHIS